MLIIDELHSLSNDSVKRLLLDHPSVPKTFYAVEGQRVFVFNKLIHLSLEAVADGVLHIDLTPKKIEELLPLAYVSPEEAVFEWGIRPFPYEVVSKQGFTGNDCFYIQHPLLSAFVNIPYSSEADALKDVVKLLMGDILPAKGDLLTSQGQLLQVFPELSLTTLTDCPYSDVLLDGFAPTASPHRKLWVLLESLAICKSRSTTASENTYLPKPFSTKYFEVFNDIHKVWKDKLIQLKHEASAEGLPLLFSLLTHFANKLAKPDDIIADVLSEDIVSLRQHFPQLKMLSDATLYDHFDSYMLFMHNQSFWEISAFNSEAFKPDFFFYLLGSCLTEKHLAIESYELAGQIFIAMYRLGEGVDLATKKTKAIIAYNHKIMKLSGLIGKAEYFLKLDVEEPSYIPTVTTTLDIFKAGMGIRKKSSSNTTILTSQRIPKG